MSVHEKLGGSSCFPAEKFSEPFHLAYTVQDKSLYNLVLYVCGKDLCMRVTPFILKSPVVSQKIKCRY